MPRKPVTNEQLKQRLELCREFGVVVYQENDAGFSFQLGPLAVAPIRIVEPPLTKEEANARRTAEFRRVATMHNPGARSRS